MLNALGFRSSERTVRIIPTEQDREAAERRLKEYGITGRRPIIGMAPGAAYGPAKRWFPERFAAVADRLIGRFACPVLLFGGAGDRASTEAVQSAAQSAFIDIAGRTDPEGGHRTDRPMRSVHHKRFGAHARGGGPGRSHGGHFRVHQPGDDLSHGGTYRHRPQGRRLQSLPQAGVPHRFSSAWTSSLSTRCSTNRSGCLTKRDITKD